jgi:hypothetical protein
VNGKVQSAGVQGVGGLGVGAAGAGVGDADVAGVAVIGTHILFITFELPGAHIVPAGEEVRLHHPVETLGKVRPLALLDRDSFLFTHFIMLFYIIFLSEI